MSRPRPEERRIYNMLVSMKAVLDLADAKKIAVGAFNITSLEGIQAVLGAAE